MQDIAGKVALITGGASGIGLAMARSLARAGSKVALADVDAARLSGAAADLRNSGATVDEVLLDVANPAAWDEALSGIQNRLGPVQICCNNAGVGPGASDVADLSPELWNWTLGVNLNGVFHGSRAVARRLRQLELPGHIVNTASILGTFPIGKQPAYVATKYAVVGLSEAMRIDLAPSGIGVSVLCPGLVETPLRANSLALRPGEKDGDYGLSGGQGPLAGRPAGMNPAPIGEMVVESIRKNRFYIFPHPEYRDSVEQRMRRMLEAFREPAQAGYREDESFLGAASRTLFDQEL
jgi:2-hydroxycyclohexanecarboxyl-CoA dehydrogenase